MNFVGYLIIAALAMGGGVIGGLLAFRTGLADKFPQALWLGRVVFAWVWAQIGKRLWINLVNAMKQP